MKAHRESMADSSASPGQGRAGAGSLAPLMGARRGWGIISAKRKGNINGWVFRENQRLWEDGPGEIIRDRQTQGGTALRILRKWKSSLINNPVDPNKPSLGDRHDTIHTSIQNPHPPGRQLSKAWELPAMSIRLTERQTTDRD